MNIALLLFLQVALCDGRAISKTRAFQMHNYVVDAETFAKVTGKPPQGRWMIDPVFFTRFMRVTDSDPTAHHSDGEKRGFTTTLYSSMPGWSRDGKKLILYSGVNAHELWQGQPPFQKIRNLPIAPNDIEHVYWSWVPGKEHVFYYPSSVNGELKLYQVTVGDTTDTKTAIHDFKAAPTNCTTATSPRGLRFATMGTSRDARALVGMSCGDTCWVYSITEDKVLQQRSDCNTSKSSMNAPFVSPSGTRAYIAAGKVPGLGEAIGLAYPVEPSTAPKSNVDYGIKEEHRSIGSAASGADIYTAVMFEAEKTQVWNGTALVSSPCTKTIQGCKPSGTLIATDMLTGRWKALISQASGWPGPYSTVHTSMTSVDAPGWIFASQVGAMDIDSPQPQGMNVLYAANYDTGQVCQLLHLRTLAGTRVPNNWGYWGEPHPNGSPDAHYVAWDSDWLNGDSVNVYIADLTWHITAAQKLKLESQ